MSKKLIAGAGVVASFAIALAPLATFADDNVTSHTDTLRLTIPAVCTLGTVTDGVPDASTDSTNHTTVADWATTTAASGQTGATDTLDIDVMPGQAYSALATSTFSIKCNKAGGYLFQAAASSANLADSASHTIPTGAGTSADLTQDNNSYWNFKVSAVSNPYGTSGDNVSAGGQEIAEGYNAAHAVPTSATTIVTGHGDMSVQTAETIEVTYGAGIDSFQEAGTYTGNVVYTLVAQ